jgi:hypothetical protein
MFGDSTRWEEFKVQVGQLFDYLEANPNRQPAHKRMQSSEDLLGMILHGKEGQGSSGIDLAEEIRRGVHLYQNRMERYT